MKIKRVIVDEMPTGCAYCLMSFEYGDGTSGCEISDSPEHLNGEQRPSWCPLEVEEEKANE
jgi:hypothetical protein